MGLNPASDSGFIKKNQAMTSPAAVYDTALKEGSKGHPEQ